MKKIILAIILCSFVLLATNAAAGDIVMISKGKLTKVTEANIVGMMSKAPGAIRFAGEDADFDAFVTASAENLTNRMKEIYQKAVEERLDNRDFYNQFEQQLESGSLRDQFDNIWNEVQQLVELMFQYGACDGFLKDLAAMFKGDQNDTDGDGFTDGQESSVGTDPSNSNSHPGEKQGNGMIVPPDWPGISTLQALNVSMQKLTVLENQILMNIMKNNLKMQ